MDGTEILLAGDCTHIGRAIGWALKYKGHRVQAASSPEAALEVLVAKNYDLLLYVFAPGDRDGVSIIRRARKLNPEVRVILVSADPKGTFPLAVYQMEVDDYLVMPFSSAELSRRVAHCLEGAKDRFIEVSGTKPGDEVNTTLATHLLSLFHDIRSSLVAVTASLRLVTRGTYGPLDSRATARLKKVDDRIQKLIKMTEEFINQALAPTPQDECAGDNWDLKADIVEPVLEECSGEIQDRQIIIDNRVYSSPFDPIRVRGSKFWLKSVFRNLLTNGINYGGRGCTITINYTRQGSVHRLHVANTGRRIPEGQRSLLFSKFGNQPAKGRRRGLGLGLYLSRDLIKHQGGNLWYEPRGDGSEFVVALPRG